MPYTQLTPESWDAKKRRMLVIGAPDMGKTFSLLTAEPRVAIVSAPLEEGSSTIPPNNPNVQAFVCNLDFSQPISWGQEVDGVKQLVTEILAGKYGEFRTLAVDGLHKFYLSWLYRNDPGLPKGEPLLEAFKLYPGVNNPFFLELKRCMSVIERGNPAGIRNLICTAWLAPDKDNPNVTKMASATQHEYPALAGKAGRDIVGEFSVVVKADREGPRFVWRTKPDELVWGVGIKAPPEIAARIPAVIDQKWDVLAKHLGIEAAAPRMTPAMSPIKGGGMASVNTPQIITNQGARK